MADKMLHTKAEVISGKIKESDGILDAVVGSSDVLDRSNDIIDQVGWQLKNYKKNPVILWGHNIKEERPPIGKALRVWLDRGEGKAKKKGEAKLMFKVQFDLQDSFAAEIFRKVRDGFLSTVSVGFLPGEWEAIDEDKPGRRYLQQELLELSFVPVPANPEALVELRKVNIEPVELKDLYPVGKKGKVKKTKKDEKVEEKKKEKTQQKTKEKTKKKVKTKDVEGKSVDIAKPYPNEHACRLRRPGDFKEGSFRRTSRTSGGKKYGIIMGRLKGETTMTEQSYRYPKGTWNASSARAHCKKHDGQRFEPASGGASTPKEETETKGVLPFKDLGILPGSASWDGPGEMKRAEVSDLKLICTWFDSSKSDVKSSYKLPHHKAEGHKAVWRGVAAAMAALLGARGGADIPQEDKRGIYNHLKKHYKQFGKEAPDFKLVEEQVLESLDEEIHALILDREDKYAIRLIKRTLKEIKENRRVIEPTIVVDERVDKKKIVEALKILDKATSLLSKDIQLEGGGKEG